MNPQNSSQPGQQPNNQPQPQPAATPVPQQPADGGQPVQNPLAVMQSGERVICEVKRHPIGLVGIYGMVGFVLIVLAVVLFGVVPSVAGNGGDDVMRYGAAFYLLVAVLALGFAFVANTVYWGNRWIITTDSLTQVTQSGLFSKQSSQLSLGNLEDITAEQNGILSHMFNYGVLKAETAGEHSKFTFYYCPNPTHYAREILNAREQFHQQNPNGH